MIDLRIVGDVHQDYDAYWAALGGAKRSLQVGDMGFNYDFLNERLDPSLHKFVGGNHDNYSKNAEGEFYKLPRHALGNYGRFKCEAFPDIFYVRGASSIDRARRTEGVDWWPEEENSYSTLQNAYDHYKTVKPNIVVTHTAPIDAIKEIPVNPRFGPVVHYDLTANALQCMWENHAPKLWVFGHWHYDIDVTLHGTRFICLDELSYLDLMAAAPYNPLRIVRSDKNAWRRAVPK